MKKISCIPILLLATALMYSCEKLGINESETYANIDTDFYEMDFNVEPMDKAGFHIFAEEFFPGNIDQLLKDAGMGDKQVEEIEITEATVSLKETENYDNFDILKFIELTAYSDNVGETKIAWRDPVPSAMNPLELDVSDTDVLPYFKEDQFILTAQGYLKSRINVEMQLNARAKFRIKIRLD